MEQAGGLFEIQSSGAQTGTTNVYLGNIGSNVVVEEDNVAENEGE